VILFALLAANSIYLASITVLEWSSRRWGDAFTYQDRFYLIMFLVHLGLGVLLVVPYVLFGSVHYWIARHHPNRRATRLGLALLGTGIAILCTGLLLVRMEGVFELKNPTVRSVLYWLHVTSPLAVAWLYWLHRLAGSGIRWRVGLAYGFALSLIIVMLVVLQTRDPLNWRATASARGADAFRPSLARTRHGTLIPASALMRDKYCLQCHADAHRQWQGSMHHWSSFNNPAYLATILDLRKALIQRDGDAKAVRWCAGCHDPVPLFAGAFDDPNFDLVNDPIGKAGVTCTACHAITHVNSVRGNGDYVIDEPIQYPFATSTNPVLKFINHTLIKAKPSFHKQVFLKPIHKTAEFCSACHKVHLPWQVTHYKEFLRGQNHYDSFLLSGVSGHGARSFYYPKKAARNCGSCHMPLARSNDFGARAFDATAGRSIHDHSFSGPNTAIPWLQHMAGVVQANQQFLKDIVRVDLFGIRDGGTIEGTLHAPLRPAVPTLKPGGEYLIEAVIRTLKIGHHFTQGTTDSNEIWLRLRVTSGARVLGESGMRGRDGQVDPWAHFVNVFMLDRDGNRINRRNAQDIFVPLYDHQIPPGAAQTVHYRLRVPDDIQAPVRIELRLNYRKFDAEYMNFVDRTLAGAAPGANALRGHRAGAPYRNELPITILAEDVVTLPVAGVPANAVNARRAIPAWQRWNDYGIGLFLKGKAELRQAADAFAEVARLDRYDGPLNLARVYYREGRLDEAVAALQGAARCTTPSPPPWTLAWLSGLVNREQGHLAEAERDLNTVLAMRTEPMQRRGFDFSKDYEVINQLGLTQFYRAQQTSGGRQGEERVKRLRQAARSFEKTLQLDPENVTAHYNLGILYGQLGDAERAARHRALHARYRVDDNARDRAVGLARQRYPAANRASQAVVIYTLHPAVPSAGRRSPSAAAAEVEAGP